MAEENVSQDNNNTEQGEVKHDDILPDWAREKLTKANNEAAKYRNEKKEAVEAAKQEVAESYSNKIEELEAQVAEKEQAQEQVRSETEKLKAAIGAYVPDADRIFSFADLLKGESPEDYASHAEELKKLFTTEETPTKKSATDPTQGTGGKSTPLNGDPLLAAVMQAIK